MRALVYEGERAVRLRSLPDPVAGDGELQVRVAAVGVCGSDLGLFRHGLPGIAPPVVPGHEFGGWLDDGRFVVVNPAAGCGACAVCAAGRPHLCGRYGLMGYTRAGAYADRVVVPRRSVVPAPGLDRVRAALVEPIANGLHAWHRSGRPAAEVAIIGAGAIGMTLLHVLRSHGVTGITVIDPLGERREAARGAGADATGERLAGEHEVVFDAAGTASTRRDAVRCTRPGGTVALLGLHDPRIDVPALPVIAGDRTLAGCYAYTEREFEAAVALAATIDAPWVEEVPADAAEAAIADLVDGRGPPGRIKTLIGFAS